MYPRKRKIGKVQRRFFMVADTKNMIPIRTALEYQKGFGIKKYWWALTLILPSFYDIFWRVFKLSNRLNPAGKVVCYRFHGFNKFWSNWSNGCLRGRLKDVTVRRPYLKPPKSPRRWGICSWISCSLTDFPLTTNSVAHRDTDLIRENLSMDWVGPTSLLLATSFSAELSANTTISTLLAK